MSDHLKLYAIEFVGHYPIGAVAVVMASDETKAMLAFMDKLHVEEPILWEDQRADDLVITKLPSEEDRCTILLNGDY